MTVKVLTKPAAVGDLTARVARLLHDGTVAHLESEE